MLPPTNRTSQPCHHMVGFLNRASDGSARGLGAWYAAAHAARCGPCRRFLEQLIQNRRQLRESRESQVDQEAIQRLSAMLHSIEPGKNRN